jgi:hypothetical protein
VVSENTASDEFFQLQKIAMIRRVDTLTSGEKNPVQRTVPRSLMYRVIVNSVCIARALAMSPVHRQGVRKLHPG